MSDYSNSFNGAGKDSGNDIIYGADIDTQLDNVATASTTKANKIIPSTTSNVATLSGTGDLQDGGFSFTNATGAITSTHTELNLLDGAVVTTAEINQLSGKTNVGFPSGTLMLFQQTAAPTGWTKQTTHNDKALRVVSGTASSGGSSAFSTVFGKTATDAHTLSITEIPAHDHDFTQAAATSSAAAGSLGGGDGNLNTSISFNTASAGGGGSHAHNMDIRVQYVDLIIASKD